MSDQLLVDMTTVGGQGIQIANPHWRFDPMGQAKAFGTIGDTWWQAKELDRWSRCAFGEAPVYQEGKFKRVWIWADSDHDPSFLPEFPLE